MLSEVKSLDIDIVIVSIHTARNSLCSLAPYVSQARPCFVAHVPSLLSVICRRSGCAPCLQSTAKTKAIWPSLQRRCQEASAGGRSPASCASWASSRALAASTRAGRGRRRCCTRISQLSTSSLVGSWHLTLLTVHTVAWSRCCPCFFV